MTSGPIHLQVPLPAPRPAAEPVRPIDRLAVFTRRSEAAPAGPRPELSMPVETPPLPLPPLGPAALGRKLPPPVRLKMEQIFAADFSDVRVHVGEEAGALGSLAFARGSDLHFAPGQFDPQSSRGQGILAHELAHVVQQREGRVSRPAVGGPEVVRQPSLEVEAERMGSRAASRNAARPGPHTVEPRGGLHSPAPPTRATDAGAARPIQPLVNLGWVPANPKKWRKYTTLQGSTNATNANKSFDQPSRIQVEDDNLNHAKKVAPVVPAGKYPASDATKSVLLTAKLAATLAPEVDHIVPRVQGGSNDLENARLISKKENNPYSKVARPKVAKDKELRLYTKLEMKVKGKTYKVPRGQDLTDAEAGVLSQAAGQGALTLANLAVEDLEAIQALTVHPKKWVNGIRRG